jgi:hypothetical protein
MSARPKPLTAAERRVFNAAMYWYAVTMRGGCAISPALYYKALAELGSACALAKKGKP